MSQGRLSVSRTKRRGDFVLQGVQVGGRGADGGRAGAERDEAARHAVRVMEVAVVRVSGHQQIQGLHVRRGGL